jgi:2-isopropylmalate synthase
MSPEEVIEKAVNAVEYAKSHGLQVEFSAEDATRSDIAFLTKVFTAVVEAGADRVDVPDTVGYATPEFISHLVQVIKKQIDIPISLHCHNDFGLAVANSIAGINAGAACAHVTVNGLGERAGNASLEEFAYTRRSIIFVQNYFMRLPDLFPILWG